MPDPAPLTGPIGASGAAKVQAGAEGAAKPQVGAEGAIKPQAGAEGATKLQAGAEGATPAMAQWFAAKAAYPDALIFFRMGDFYELFFDDAARAASALDIQLTQRGSHAGRPIDMCGVPLHAADAYLARLIRNGFRVAIAEQTEDPKARKPGSKAPLRRAVVRLVTPGTLTEDTLLDPGRPNLLLALVPDDAGDRLGAAWADISAGGFFTEVLDRAAVPDLLARLGPSEILAPAGLDLGAWRALRAPAAPDLADPGILAEAYPDADPGLALTAAEQGAAAVLLAYVRATQAGALPRLKPPCAGAGAGSLLMDAATRANLELLTARDGGTRHSLLDCVRRTATGPGARLLAEHLAAPSTDPAAIAARQDAWDWLLTVPSALEALRATLRRLPDMARALGRLSLRRAAPRDLAAIAAGLAAGTTIASELDRNGTLPVLLASLRADLAPAPDLGRALHDALAETLPARLEEGGLIAPGYDAELDALRRLRDHGRTALATLQLDMAQRHGVASLKIRHHQQLGYVLEVPAAAAERLRAVPDLVLRQSMAGAARFGCKELTELEQRITNATDQAAAREAALWAMLSDSVLAAAPALDRLAAALAALDVAQSAAALAATGRWCRPRVSDSAAFTVSAGRHPVVEAALDPGARFIANDCSLEPGRRLVLLTGPNMAGKSTFLRQNALLVVLAQAGQPVPAASASIGVVDRLFCRVGAADDLARGRSTFMVEMTEAATILRDATPRSLLVIDEIGRGTATLDGLAIAWAMLEALHNTVRARTIFATHFHELVRLRHELPQLCPHTMRVKEWKGSVVFLHEVAEGATGRSWGVQVARLAGVPAAVLRRADAVLQGLEARAVGLTQDLELPLLAYGTNATDNASDAETAGPWSDLLVTLDRIEPDQLSPRQALEALYELKSVRRGLAGQA